MSFPERSHSSANPSVLHKPQEYTEESGVQSQKLAERAKADHASALQAPQVQEEEQDDGLGNSGSWGTMNVLGQDDTVTEGMKAMDSEEQLVPATAGTARPNGPVQDDGNLMDDPLVDDLDEPIKPTETAFSVQELKNTLVPDPSHLPLPALSEPLAAPTQIDDYVTAPVAFSRRTQDPEPVAKEPVAKGSVPKDPRGERKADEDDSQSEIQSILDQFDEKGLESGEQEATAGLAPNSHPPRKSSLEPLGPGRSLHENGSSGNIPAASASYFSEPTELDHTHGQRKQSRMGSVNSLEYSRPGRLSSSGANGPSSPISPTSLQKSLPPVPDPEPDLPFDFHRFLEQLRHRTADPVAKFLRSFLIEFGKKQWMIHEQVKIISDFLTFITGKMAQCEVWREVSDAEFDNAKEGMEKLVMNRLYSQTFSPAIPPPVPIPPAKGKRKTVEKALGPGRRGQHQEDIERDEVLAQKVRIYGWVREEHLDITPIGDSGRRFLSLAQQGDNTKSFPRCFVLTYEKSYLR